MLSENSGFSNNNATASMFPLLTFSFWLHIVPLNTSPGCHGPNVYVLTYWLIVTENVWYSY